jgi:hypothetical protein
MKMKKISENSIYYQAFMAAYAWIKVLLNSFTFIFKNQSDSLATFSKVVYIKLEDVAYQLKYPTVIDLKIGIETYDPESNDETIKRHKLKFPFMESIGFQVEGMRVLDYNNDSFIHLNKNICRSFNKNSILHGKYNFIKSRL